jgi:dTDP-4-amino-4,6-dideoxygalactose transaminase
MDELKKESTAINRQNMAQIISDRMKSIAEFEQALSNYTGAPYAIMTDCGTHALELCLRYEDPAHIECTAFTYLSVPMLFRRLDIEYHMTDEWWIGEYRFHGSRIWDSARLLRPDMYRPGMLQCLSFGFDKPLNIGHGGAILTDDPKFYQKAIRQRSDGRDLSISPWQDQQVFEIGYHYRPTPEDAERGLELLGSHKEEPTPKRYPDLRKIRII